MTRVENFLIWSFFGQVLVMLGLIGVAIIQIYGNLALTYFGYPEAWGYGSVFYEIINKIMVIVGFLCGGITINLVGIIILGIRDSDENK
jgi:hypothetical protein